MGMRKRFYLGDLDDGPNPLRAVRWDIHLAEGVGAHFDPSTAGWTFYINDKAVPLDYDYRTGLLSLRVPINLLKAKTENEFFLVAETPYRQRTMHRAHDILPVMTYPDILDVDSPWFYTEAPDSVHLQHDPQVMDNHSAWLFAPRVLPFERN